MTEAVKFGDLLDDPVLWLGVDIGVKRDTAAVAAVVRHPDKPMSGLWGLRVYKPPVNIHTTVVALLLNLLENQRVAEIRFDPSQFLSEAQRLADKGYERILKEVNQQTEMIGYANNLDTHLKEGTFLLYTDPELRAHFSWAAAEITERGYRIVKRKQSRPIDGVVAIAMALAGATEDTQGTVYPSYRDQQHARSMFDLP